MSRHWLILLVALFAIPLVAFVAVSRQLTSVTQRTYSYETTIRWTGHDNVELNADSLKRLNDEIADKMYLAGLKTQQYKVVSLGKGRVEAMYLDQKDLPAALRQTLEAYIRQRASELASVQH